MTPEPHAAGVVTQLVDDAAALDAALADTVTTLASHAPLSMWAVKQSLAGCGEPPERSEGNRARHRLEGPDRQEERGG